MQARARTRGARHKWRPWTHPPRPRGGWLWATVVWTVLISVAIPVGWSAPAGAQPFCGWQANYPGTTGASGFSVTPGVEAMPRNVVVRTTVGTPAVLSTAVNDAIAAVNGASRARWRRGADVAPPPQLTTADRRFRPPPGELWVVGTPRAYPLLPPGTYTSAIIERVRGGPAMPVSTLVVLADALAGPAFSQPRRLNAVLHEFGHAAGLDHHFAPWGGQCQVMSYGGASRLGAGDTAGLQWLVSRAPTTPLWGNPFGNLEAVRRVGGGVRISGWAIDPDTTAPIDVHLYVNGRPRAGVRAGDPRPDVGLAYPAAGGDRGFAATLAVQPGRTLQVCAYAINVGVGTANPLIGCRQVVT